MSDLSMETPLAELEILRVRNQERARLLAIQGFMIPDLYPTLLLETIVQNMWGADFLIMVQLNAQKGLEQQLDNAEAEIRKAQLTQVPTLNNPNFGIK